MPGHAGISDVNVVTDEVTRSLGLGGGHFGGYTPYTKPRQRVTSGTYRKWLCGRIFSEDVLIDT